jgi:hypothetical protein
MLDSRKIARIIANRARLQQGRQRNVTAVYNRPEGLAYVPIQCTWTSQMYTEPQALPQPENEIHAIAEVPLSIDPRQISFIADTPIPTADAIAAADKYEIAQYRQAGIIPNRWRLHLRRLR